MTLIKEMDLNKRGKLRATLEEVIKQRKKQKEFFENTIISYFKQIINMGEDTLKNKEHIENFIKVNKEFSKWIKKGVRC